MRYSKFSVFINFNILRNFFNYNIGIFIKKYLFNINYIQAFNINYIQAFILTFLILLKKKNCFKEKFFDINRNRLILN